MKYSTAETTIDLKAIKSNYLFIKKYCSKAEVAASVKASGYGLEGQNKIVSLLRNLKCKNFFVANIKEALTIRKNLKMYQYIY